MASAPCSSSAFNDKKRRRKTRLDKDARIVIIGSGLGGLGACISLEQAGFTNVAVMERDVSPTSRREGYGLTLTYNPKGPLAQMNLLEEVAQRDCPSRSHYMFQPDGSILGYYGNAFDPHRGKGQRGNLRVPRQVLRQVMLDRIKSTIHWNKQLVSFRQKSNNDKLRLSFHDGSVMDDVDLLVGADGIRSVVVQTMVGSTDKHVKGLRYLGIMIILGIAEFSHAHLDERGFYTLDGRHRLFTMPYEGSRLEDDENHRDVSKRRTMWQLSFRMEDEVEAKRLGAAGPSTLRDEVLKRCRGWHCPVEDMVRATPLDTVWGTALMDRDPIELLQSVDLSASPRVVALGDAVHSMSPFKGQGANQALMDGPLLASWLQSASVDSAVRSFWREMVQRTAPKVEASRKAAALLHSPECVSRIHDFAGVLPECISHLLVALKSRGITAENGAMLDQLVQETIDDLGYGKTEIDEVSPEDDKLCKHALVLASEGDCIGLRNLSRQSSRAICHARDDGKRSCLHLAVMGGHYHTCRWLLTEAHVSPDIKDHERRTAWHVAVDMGHRDIARLLMRSTSS